MALTLQVSGEYGPEVARDLGSIVTRNGKAYYVQDIEPRRNRVRVKPVDGGRAAWATPHECGCFWTGPATFAHGATDDRGADVLLAQAAAMRSKARAIRHGYPVTADKFKASAADLEAQAAAYIGAAR